jgi:hypothetical protein
MRVKVSRSDGSTLVESFDGFAADGVLSVALIGSGRVLAESPVLRNTFSLALAGTSLPAGSVLTARDASGSVVFEEVFTPRNPGGSS